MWQIANCEFTVRLHVYFTVSTVGDNTGIVNYNCSIPLLHIRLPC